MPQTFYDTEVEVNIEVAEEETGSPPHLIKQILLNKPVSAPVFNEIALKLQKLAQKENYNLEDALKLINNDPNLSAEMLRHSNSSFNMGLETITTIRAAVVRLGSKQIVNLAFTASMSSHKSDNPLINKFLTICWEHSFAVARSSIILSKYLAKEHDIRIEISEEEIYLAGLFHSIGALCVLKDLDELGVKKTLKLVDENIKEFLDALYILVGMRGLKHWGLPKQYSDIIEGLDLGQRWKTSPYVNTIAIIRICSKVCTEFIADVMCKKDQMEWIITELEFLGLENDEAFIEKVRSLLNNSEGIL